MAFLKYKTELLGLLFSFIVAVVFWRILVIPTKIFIVPAITLIFFSTYRYMAYDGAAYCLTSLKLRKIPFMCLIVLSTLAILYVHPINDVEFIPWSMIPPLNLLRLVLGSFLTLFSPGYMLLSLMDRKDSLTGTEKLFFCMVFSLFLLPLLGCLCFALGSSILRVGASSIIILNLALLTPYILFKKDDADKKISFNLNEKLILLSLLTFIATVLLEKYILNLTWDYGDLDIYYGYSVCFTKEIFPISKIGLGLAYPYWPFIFVAEFFIISGIPYVNAFQFINIPISFIPVLSFYIMASAFFRRHEIPIVATVLGFFGGGFGWIFGIHLLLGDQTNQTLYELFNIMAETNSGYLIPSFYTAPGITGMYPLYTYALTSIFALIWLIYSKRAIEIGNLRYVLISVMIALGYLAHIAEICFFVFIFLTSLLFFKHKNLSLYRKCAVSIICGLILVALPDIIVGGSQYIWGDPFTYYGFSIYFGTIGLAVFAFFLSFVKTNLKISSISIKINQKKLRALKVVCLNLIIYFYLLCFIIWSKVYETYSYLPMQNHTVPWYAWVNRFGINGLIALPGIIYLIYKSREIKDYLFFLLLVPVSFVIARILHVYSSFYMEDRITFFIMISITILASFTLFKLMQFLKRCVKENIKNIALGSVLATILVFGFLPGLLVNEAVDLNRWSMGKQLSSSELDALNFLRLNTPSNASVLTLTDRSKRLLSYAGLFPVQTDVNKDPSLILSIISPETAFYSLSKSQLKYIYLASADQKELEENPSFTGVIKSQLLEYLPIAFQNDEVTIYEVPKFAFSTNSSMALVISNPKVRYFKDMFDETYGKFCRFCSIVSAGDVIAIRTNSQDKNHDFELPVNINPKEYPYVTIRWKTDGSHLYFYLLTSDNVYYTSLGCSKDWQTTMINLHNYYDFVRKKFMNVEEGKQITSILFRGEKNSEYSIDYIQFANFPGNDILPLSMIALSQTEYSTILEDDPARFRYQTLILTHDLNMWDETEKQEFQRYLQWINQGGRLIVLESLGTYWPYENRNLTLSDYLGWRDENLTTGWFTSECSASFNDTVVTVRANNSNKNHDFISPHINVSVDSYPYVVVRWKADGSPLYFYLHGTQSNYHYINLGTSTEWTISAVNLKDFYDFVLKNNTGFKDGERIDGLLFRSFIKNATYSIDYIRFYKKYPLPPRPAFADLLQIYTEGVTEADGIKSKTGQLDFPSTITTPIINSNDMNTKIIANYTRNNEQVSPYAFAKKIGNGEVIYLVVSPFFSALNSSTGKIKTNFFRNMGSLINVLDLKLNKNTEKWTNYFPQFDYIKEPVNLTGKVSVGTDYIQLPKLKADYIRVLYDDGRIKAMNLNNSIVDKIEYDYQVKFMINGSEICLSRSGLGKYTNIKIIGDFSLTMEIPKNSTVKMLMGDDKLLDETFQGSTVQLSIDNNGGTFLLVKNPAITTEGNAYFGRARIYRNHYRLPLFYDDGSNPFEVIGNTKFTIKYSDNGLLFVDNFTVNGKLFYPKTEQGQLSFTEMDIPWLSVLVSPFHVLLVAMMFAFLVGYAYITVKKIKIRIKLKLRWCEFAFNSYRV